MAKKKFVEKRRKEAQRDLRDGISARAKANEFVDTVRGLGVEFEVYNSDDESEYYGLMFSYDPPDDVTWIVIKNPLGGPEIELTISYGFGVGFAGGYWLFPPTQRGYQEFVDMVRAILEDRASSVSFIVDGEREASALLKDKELDSENELRFLNTIAAKDYWMTEGGIYGMPEKAHVAELQTKLRRIRSRKAWSAEFKFWNPAKDRVEVFDRSRI